MHAASVEEGDVSSGLDMIPVCCRLVEMGFEKMVNEMDVKEAARLGMHSKPLTVANVQKHLEDLGIDPEFGTHSRIRGLSGLLSLFAQMSFLLQHVLVLLCTGSYLEAESDMRKSYGLLCLASHDFAMLRIVKRPSDVQCVLSGGSC